MCRCIVPHLVNLYAYNSTRWTSQVKRTIRTCQSPERERRVGPTGRSRSGVPTARHAQERNCRLFAWCQPGCWAEGCFSAKKAQRERSRGRTILLLSGPLTAPGNLLRRGPFCTTCMLGRIIPLWRGRKRGLPANLCHKCDAYHTPRRGISVENPRPPFLLRTHIANSSQSQTLQQRVLRGRRSPRSVPRSLRFAHAIKVVVWFVHSGS
jgi:hypothetical protein